MSKNTRLFFGFSLPRKYNEPDTGARRNVLRDRFRSRRYYFRDRWLLASADAVQLAWNDKHFFGIINSFTKKRNPYRLGAYPPDKGGIISIQKNNRLDGYRREFSEENNSVLLCTKKKKPEWNVVAYIETRRTGVWWREIKQKKCPSRIIRYSTCLSYAYYIYTSTRAHTSGGNGIRQIKSLKYVSYLFVAAYTSRISINVRTCLCISAVISRVLRNNYNRRVFTRTTVLGIRNVAYDNNNNDDDDGRD